MFQLNILKAGSGDSILIKYKSGNSEKHILIDGGVGKIYEKELKHLIDTLPQLDLVIVTHIDRDHIGGINKLLNSKNSSKIQEVLFNSADLIRKNDSNLISISDGINLVEFLKKQNIKLIDTVKIIGSKLTDDVMKIEFLSPSPEALNYLEKNWSEMEKEQKSTLMTSYKKIDNRNLDEIANDKFEELNYKNDIANWSSLAFEIKYKDICILFLGDAKDSVIVNTLKNNGYSSNKKFKIDYIKLSHHGSKYNTSTEFLELVDCNHFIFSTNGTDQKPHIQTIARILCNKGRDVNQKIYLYFNYPREQYESKKVRLLTKEEEEKYNCECIFNKNIFELEE